MNEIIHTYKTRINIRQPNFGTSSTYIIVAVHLRLLDTCSIIVQASTECITDARPWSRFWTICACAVVAGAHVCRRFSYLCPRMFSSNFRYIYTHETKICKFVGKTVLEVFRPRIYRIVKLCFLLENSATKKIFSQILPIEGNFKHSLYTFINRSFDYLPFSDCYQKFKWNIKMQINRTASTWLSLQGVYIHKK